MTMANAQSNTRVWRDDLHGSVRKPHLPKNPTGPPRKDDRRNPPRASSLGGTRGVAGRTARRHTARPSRFRIAIPAGPSGASGQAASATCPPSGGHRRSPASRARSSQRPARPAGPRGRPRRHRPQPRRTPDEHSRRHGHPRPSARGRADAGHCVRHPGRPAASRTAQGVKAASG